LGSAFEFVVVEEWGEEEGFLIRLIQKRETLDGFGDVEAAVGVEFLAAEFLVEEEFFSGCIRKAFDHMAENTRKDEAGQCEIRLFVYFQVLGRFRSLRRRRARTQREDLPVHPRAARKDRYHQIRL